MVFRTKHVSPSSSNSPFCSLSDQQTHWPRDVTLATRLNPIRNEIRVREQETKSSATNGFFALTIRLDQVEAVQPQCTD